MTIPVKLIIALLLGAAIGLEREAYEKKIDRTAKSGRGSLGIRTYALISLLGSIAGLSYDAHLPVFILISSAFSLLLISYYILGSRVTGDIGMTTEVAILMCFVLGVLVGIGFLPIQIVIALTVVLVLILSLKDEIRSFVAGVKEYELDAFISYAIIALVILPFLPDVSYTLSDVPGIKTLLGPLFNSLGKLELVNPFNLWKVVAIITGIEVSGYLLEKTIGQKGGWLLTSFAGGFISSTSTTQSLAIRSKKIKTSDRLLTSALVANVSSFIQHFILIASINPQLLGKSMGYIAGLILGGTLIAAYFFTRKESGKKDRIAGTQKNYESVSIFSLKPALQFALLFLIIKFVSKAALVLFGQSAFYVTAAFSALAGMDAITINIGELAGKMVSWQVAVIALMLANTVNLLAKSVYSYFLGTRSFSLRFFASMMGIIACGVLGLVLFL